MTEETTPNKPFHLLSPKEKTTLRIAQNRAITERIALSGAGTTTGRAKTRQSAAAKPSSTSDFIRATPEERAALKVGSVIRKVQS
jgi:hypothetical protein